MGMFDGIENAGPQKLPFLGKGRYPKLEVVSLSSGQSKKGGAAVPFFKAEVKVLESQGETPAGTNAVIVHKQDQYGYWLQDTRSCIAAITQEPLESVNGKFAEAICGEKQPAKGNFFSAEVTPGQSKAGKTFYRTTYFPYTKQ